ncbi:MAG: pyrroline-5-carboxylate reductase [Proteobacteria bacterium]|nr:pyrroline-5-carboxylate reductase [Pseudomonadota bacterium]
MSNDRIGFIGGGNMTQAIVTGLVSSGFRPADIMIAEPSAKQREVLTQTWPDAEIAAENIRIAERANCIVLAVKPQILADVCRDLADSAQKTKPLVISIAAGIRSADIDAWLGGGLAIVRAMPNQPALLQLGVTGSFANERVSTAQKQHATRILAAVGKVVDVPHEADIDAVTAISGSGPAYFYLLIDMLTHTAQELGLDEQVAHILAIETATGATALAAASADPMAALIARVRSPGGTTAAALDSLDQQNVRDIFARALTAARDRATELADHAHAQE